MFGFGEGKNGIVKISIDDVRSLLLPQFAVIIFFFAMNLLMLDEWVGHYGASTHFNFNIQIISSNFFKYIFKYALFARYFNEPYKSELFHLTDSGVALWLLSACLLIVFSCYVIFFKRLNDVIKLAGFSFILFFIFLLPVLNLWANLILYVNNDRFAYPGSMFLWMGVALTLSALPAWVRVSVFIPAFAFSLYFLIMTVTIWKNNGEIFNSLVNDFHWYDKDQVIILGVADNLDGAKMFGIYNQPSGFAQTLKYYRKKPFTGDMEEAAQFNMVSMTDGMTPRVDSSGDLIVTFNQPNNWWWWDGMGLTDRETPAMSVKIVNNTLHVHFKNLMPNHAIIFQNGNHWEEVPNL